MSSDHSPPLNLGISRRPRVALAAMGLLAAGLITAPAAALANQGPAHANRTPTHANWTPAHANRTAAHANRAPALADQAQAPPYRPGVVIVGYAHPHPGPAAAADVASASSVSSDGTVQTKLLRLRQGVSVGAELRRLRHQRGVAYAVPDYLAHIAAASTPEWLPDDVGQAATAQGWTKTQWNFLSGTGVNAPEAWANLLGIHRAGARGVVISILDTGIAYRNWHRFRKSPDFGWTHFVHPYDFVARNRYPLDREGHGTFVAGTIAESTNNGLGLTGLAYNASIMPVRVLDQNGWGDAATIARGIRYAVAHGAQVINLSLEFDPSVTARDIPTIISAIRFAHRHGVVVVAASGNEGSPRRIAYPARAPAVISVGATTIDRCLAYYSNGGRRLDLVAPGGGDDADMPSDPNCHPDRNLPDISQMTFGNPFHPAHFSFPGGWYGTSMAAPHVAAVAAMIIASGVIGRHPSPNQILARLEATAQPLGGAKPNPNYGYGLVDAGTATARESATPLPS
jgi:serine protease